MSRRRQEIESQLPKASEPCIRHVSELCMRAELTGITAENYLFLHRAFIHYLMTTADGKMTMLKILDAEMNRATYEKQYYPEGHYGMPEHALDHSQLLEFKGWVYRGKSGPHNKIDVIDSPALSECESCHGKYPAKDCATTTRVFIGGRERLETLCNHCRMNSEDPRVRADSSGKICTSCSYTACAYHPSRPQMRVDIEERPVTPQRSLQVTNAFIGKVAAAASQDIQLEHRPTPRIDLPLDSSRFSAI